MYKIGNVTDITWDIRDFPALAWSRKPFNDASQLERWQSIGFTHANYNGLLIDASRPTDLPDWARLLAEIEFDYENIAVSLFCMMPGDIIPQHSDTYSRYRKVFGISDPNLIWRSLVMLDDWKSGHYLEIDGIPETRWTAGNTFTWNNDALHIAANIGTEPRYTLQVTGTR